MDKYKLGFLGCGNMACAIISGVIKSGILPIDSIYAYDVSTDACTAAHARFGIQAADNLNILDNVDIVILAVKPIECERVAQAWATRLNGKGLISIVAGLSFDKLCVLFSDCTVLRVMPNVAAMCGESMTVLCDNTNFDLSKREFSEIMFNSIGKSLWIAEKHIDAVTGVSGCGPAYAFIMLDAMADAGVLHGLPRSAAIELAAQTMLGACAMQLSTKTHPAVLKDMVCSPGGSTIEAVVALEQGGMRSAVINAVDAAVKKSKDMTK